MSRGGRAVVVSTVFTVLAFCFVLVRCIGRFGIVKYVGRDDILIIAALVMSIGLTVCIALEAHCGLGRHLTSLRQDEFKDMLKSVWAGVIVYNVGLVLTKDSILLQFLRFFLEPGYRGAAWALVALLSAYAIVVVLVNIFACTPIAFRWDKDISGGKCLHLLAFWLGNASFNILTDIALCLLPIPALRSLHLPRRQKYWLLMVFALCAFGCLTSVLRLYSIYVVENSKDWVWDDVGAATWSSVELNTGIVCACLPTLQPVLNLLCPHLLSPARGPRDSMPLPARGIRGSGHVARLPLGLFSEDDIVLPSCTLSVTPGSGSLSKASPRHEELALWLDQRM